MTNNFMQDMVEAQKVAPAAEPVVPSISPTRQKYTTFPAHYTDEQIEHEVECMYNMTQNMYR